MGLYYNIRVKKCDFHLQSGFYCIGSINSNSSSSSSNSSRGCSFTSSESIGPW